MTSKLVEYLHEREGKRVKFVVSNGIIVIEICEWVEGFLHIRNQRRFAELGGVAVFGLEEIESSEAMTLNEARNNFVEVNISQ